jgi:DNA-binding GntR family transcriptional regulator
VATMKSKLTTAKNGPSRATTGLTRPLPARRILREDIRDQLIEEILNGRLSPGDRIVETRIAQQFGVSQAPVREALRDLELFGFIVSAPFRGAIVRKITTEELLQIYPIRAAIEGVAAREAATRFTERGLKNLDRLFLMMRKTAARGDLRGAIDADLAFHLAIVEASGNRLLNQFWERLRLSTTTFITVLKSHRSLVEIADRHALVIAALRTREPNEAERVMRHHIEEPGEWLRAAMADADPTTAAPRPAPQKRVRHG